MVCYLKKYILLVSPAKTKCIKNLLNKSQYYFILFLNTTKYLWMSKCQTYEWHCNWLKNHEPFLRTILSHFSIAKCFIYISKINRIGKYTYLLPALKLLFSINKKIAIINIIMQTLAKFSLGFTKVNLELFLSSANTFSNIIIRSLT